MADAVNAEFESLFERNGMGALVRKSGDYVGIAQPYKGFPADKAGLVIGDKILSIDGVDTKGFETTRVSEMLRGEPGTTLRLMVGKLLTGKTEEVSFKRERITISGISYYGTLGGEVGYIVHSDFTEDCSSDFRKAFLDLKKQGIKSLVIDLRGNGGGIMQEAVKIVAMFTPRGTRVVSMRGRAEGSTKEYATQTEPLDQTMPLAVLVDGYSASAAEIVAGALQDLDRAVVVGQRTYGKGLVQNTIPVGFGSYLKVTTAKYHIPSGRCIQAIDYSQGPGRDSTGMERHQRAIPDSLISEFRTAGGRRVYDGGGVMPDVRLPAEYNSRFAVAVYAEGLIDDFAGEWCRAHRSGADPAPIDPATFALGEAGWAAFTRFMADKTLDYESATGSTLDYLRRVAEYERYLTPETRALIDSLAEKLKDDTPTGLALYRAELTEMIEEAIILRTHYQRGVIRHDMAGDPALAKALEVLGDRAGYEDILTNHDTERK
jgi:carboxyl-terminal processing protease